MKLTSYLKVTPSSINSAGLGFLLSAALLAASYAGAQDVEEVIIQGEQMTDQVLDDLVSVSAIDAEKLADAGIENVEDVAAYVPNLVLTQSITGTNIFIRGIGAGTNQGFDQSVGLYADGVPLPRSNMARAPFLDLASVQVLRGPQYVLDGNYSIAGSVHMLSNLSIDEFKAGVDFNYRPSQNDRTLLLTLGGPINDWFAANIVVQSKQTDGYVENVFLNEDGPGRDELFGRIVLGMQPNDNLSLKFKAERGRFDTTGRQIEIIFSEAMPTLVNTAPGAFGNLVTRNAAEEISYSLIATPWITETDYRLRPRGQGYSATALDLTGYVHSGKEYLSELAKLYTTNDAVVPSGLLDRELDFKRAADQREFSRNKSSNYTLSSSLWLGDHQLAATASYVTYDFDENIDGDLTPAPLLVVEQSEYYDQAFFKVEYESPKGGFVEVKAGASYLDSNLSFTDFINLELDSSALATGEVLTDWNPQQPLGAYFGQFLIPNVIQGFGDWGILRNFEQDATIQAAYIQSTLNWSDTFRSTLGFRYTSSEKQAFRELVLTGKNREPIPVVVDPTTPGRDGRTPDLSEDLSDSLNSAADQFVGFFSLQLHTDQYSLASNVDGGALTGVRREEKLLPSLTLEWDISEDVTLLSSVRRANKLGGYDARSNTRPDVPQGFGATPGTWEFEDEDALVYELGTKWYFPSGIGQISATAFFTQYQNLQVSRSDGNVGANVTNAGAAETTGVEVEGLLAFSERFNMQYSLAWIDFEFIEFLTGSCSLNRRPDNVVQLVDTDGFPRKISATGAVTPILYEEVVREVPGGGQLSFQGSNPPVNPLPAGFVAFDQTALGGSPFCDFAGQTNQFVAEWQGTLTFNYEAELMNLGILKPTLDVLYNSGYETSVVQDSDVAQEKYVQLNGRLALSDFDGIWTVAITAQNITNEKIVSSASVMPIGTGVAGQRGYFGFIQPPRTIGLNLRYKFY